MTINESDLLEARRATGQVLNPVGSGEDLPDGGSFLIISEKHAISAAHVFIRPGESSENPPGRALLTHGETSGANAVFDSSMGGSFSFPRGEYIGFEQSFANRSRDYVEITLGGNASFNEFNAVASLGVFINPGDAERIGTGVYGLSGIAITGYPLNNNRDLTVSTSSSESPVINDFEVFNGGRRLEVVGTPISSGFSGGGTWTQFTKTGEVLALGVAASTNPAFQTTTSSILTEEEFRGLIDLIASTDAKAEDLPRYFIFGAADASDARAVAGTVFRDVLVGGEGSELLSGFDADDEIIGGLGDDTLIGDGILDDPETAGNDILNGGAGIDTVDYTAAGNAAEQGIAVIVSEQTTEDGETIIEVTDPYGRTDQLINIEIIRGTAFNDDVDLSALSAIGVGFNGGAGDDNLQGGAGNDQLFGGEGLDTIRGGDGDDILGNINSPTFDYSQLDAAEISAIIESESDPFSGGGEGEGEGNAVTELDGGSGDDIYLIDYSSSYTARGGDSATDFAIVDNDPGTRILVRDISTGNVDVLGGEFTSVSWTKPGRIDQVDETQFCRVPSQSFTFYGYVGDSGAFYYAGLSTPGEPSAVDRGGNECGVEIGPSIDFDPSAQFGVRRYDSIADFLATGTEDAEPGSLQTELSLRIGTGVSLAELGQAQHSDLGFDDPPPAPEPNPSVTDDVNVTVEDDGTVTIDGGDGDDVVYLFSPAPTAPAAAINLAALSAVTSSAASAGDQFITLAGGNDVAITGDTIDVIDGGADDDIITSGGGDDLLTGGAGNDTINGGGGFDTAFFSGSAVDYNVFDENGETIVIDLNTLDGDDGEDTLIGVENIVFLADVVNTAPTDILLSNASVNENSMAGTFVGDLAAIDPDMDESFTFRVIEPGNAFFNVVGAQLVVAQGAVLDFETNPVISVDIEVEDIAGNTFAKTFDIALNDVDEGGPVISETISFARVSDRHSAAFADGVVDPDTEVLDPVNHIQHQRIIAITGDGDVELESGELGHVLSKAGYGNRVTTLPVDNGLEDPVQITAYGRLNNNTRGELTDKVRFSETVGFGLDNGPNGEPEARELDAGDALDFDVAGDGFSARALTDISFVLNTRGDPGPATLALDVDGEILAGGPGAWATGALAEIGGLVDGDLVNIDLDGRAILINGVSTAGDFSALFDAFEAAGAENITIGSSFAGGAGFALKDLVLNVEQAAPVAATTAGALNGPTAERGSTPSQSESLNAWAFDDFEMFVRRDAFRWDRDAEWGGFELTREVFDFRGLDALDVRAFTQSVPVQAASPARDEADMRAFAASDGFDLSGFVGRGADGPWSAKPAEIPLEWVREDISWASNVPVFRASIEGFDQPEFGEAYHDRRAMLWQLDDAYAML